MTAPQEAVWNGDERRSAPLHIIAYVDGRMREHTTHVETILRDHVSDEMLRFGEIQAAIKHMTVTAAENHRAVMQQWDDHARRTEAIEQAFVADERGRPDYYGHYGDHDHRRTAGERWADAKHKVATAVLQAGLIAVVGWIGFVVWRAFLQGPQP